MKLLICGSESILGRFLVDRLQQESFQVRTLSAIELLQQDALNISTLMSKEKPDLVVNVDHLPLSGNAVELERHYVDLPQQLAMSCARINTPLLQLSDCQVFSGAKETPYLEADEPDTQSAYGATRWRGECVVAEQLQRHLILRVGEMIDAEGDNILTSIIRQWQSHGSVSLSQKRFFSPTPVVDVMRVIMAIIQQLRCGIEPWGIYHYASVEAVSYYNFASAVAMMLRDIELQNIVSGDTVISADEYAAAGNWALECTHIRNVFGIRQRPWRADVLPMLRHLSRK